MKLVALDLDGTLFDNSSRISKRNLTAIRSITDKGIHVVISTGRPFEGIPFDQIKGTGINYAITANGSGIYEISTGKCLYENAMDEELVTPILNFLLTRDIHMDAFIGGKGYTPIQCVETAQKLTVPSSIKNYIITTRTRLDNILQFIHENQLKVQKMTLNFYPAADGTLIDRETVRKFLVSNPSITTVCGGYNNLEFTRADANKGVGLRKLAEILGVNPDATMAIGDTENDLAIIEAAGIGVAMGNATDAVKARADYVTTTNTKDGVAAAIEHFIL
ncbi:MAG TPA: Cof-type HAD-IIB family hydrolase [Roseburia sp.]|nr:Cof-type HAD-IIB family hydrolase [Agathobacter sp.]OLA58726.1 MAG: HAD family hydrolase [Roseburia sp. CAG:18_43_25]HBA07235.1 Cof-type HAD-IIB family hydrolase [Roseburia sp.]MBP7171026.1 Cof-type HAD-IIB family hydrolase [Agathobacter sp.]MBP9573366.1 Cof-type HAD-IIB family hydrolase [Agathobacter sp.]